jgi:SAM-dependent methyltransferase
MAGVLGPAYSEGDIGALEAEVLPKYLSFFHALAVQRLSFGPEAKVAALGLLASSLAGAIGERLPSAVVCGFEPSESGVRLARERTSSLNLSVEVEALSSLPIRCPDATFTHVVAVHPLTPPSDRRRLLAEVLRVLAPGGQLALALPLRGSYPEVADMLREYALKADSTRLSEAVEIAAQSRPTPETLTDELEGLGFDDVSVSFELLSVPFDTGRDFVGHPLLSLVVGPDVATALGLPKTAVEPALEYVGSAIGKYWSEGPFELGVNLGCVCAKKP